MRQSAGGGLDLSLRPFSHFFVLLNICDLLIHITPFIKLLIFLLFFLFFLILLFPSIFLLHHRLFFFIHRLAFLFGQESLNAVVLIFTFSVEGLFEGMGQWGLFLEHLQVVVP